MSDDVGKSVRDRLSHTAEVTKLIGGQIYEDVLAQNAPMPAVVVFVQSSQVEEDLNSSDRCFRALVQVMAFADKRSTANEIAKAIRDSALPANLQGSIEGMDFKEVSLVGGPSELVDSPTDGSDRWRRITQQTFSIWANAI